MSVPRCLRPLLCALALSIGSIGGVRAQQAATPTQADAVLKNFHFRSGDTMAELRLHYRVLGQPEKDAQGVVRNARHRRDGRTIHG
jgi:homoserine O-acetyltransferase